MSKWKISRNIVGHGFFSGYLCILFGMTFFRIFDNSFWGDECFTIRLAKLSLKDMLYATAVDVHPPLYYLLVQIGYRLLGNHGYVYHLISVIPLGITLILSATYIKRRFGLAAALLFATCSAMLPAARVSNVEARMYSWTALFILLAFLQLDIILKEDSRRAYLLFALFAICAAYTHYYALVTVAFLYAFLLIRAFCGNRKAFGKTAAISVITILAYIPWLLKFLLSFKRTATSWWLEAIPTVRDCGVFLFGSDFLMAVWIIAALAVLCNIGKAVGRIERLWFTSGICAILGLWAVGETVSYLIRPLFTTRYMYVVAAVAWLLLAVGISKCAAVFSPKREVCVSVLISCICVAVCMPGYVSEIRAEKKLDLDTAAFLESVKLPDDELILTNSGSHAWTILEYYYPTARIGESYDMAASLTENQESCVIVSTYEFSDDELEEMKQAGFTPSLYYEGAIGISTPLFVYEADCASAGKEGRVDE